jgi:hypothetical protein
MGNAATAAKLAKQFEPILLFHKDEAFHPIDPKWYLERCALWQANPRYDDKANWVLPPLIEKGKIAAIDGPKELAGGRSWIGAPGIALGVGPQVLQEHAPGPEMFLEFVGWEPPVDPPVTPTTENRHATLTETAYSAPLSGSEPWYHVEYLDNTDLKRFADNPNISANGLSLFALVATNPALKSPQMLIYHFLFPLHQETLEGCEEVGEGRLFGSYAGEWASMALLLDSDGNPLMIGLSSRNTASPSLIGGEERRVGLTAYHWADAQTVAASDGGLHPKVYVSLDTHGLYLAPGSHDLTPFTPGGIDPARQHCGQVETLDDAISGNDFIPGTPGSGHGPDTSVWIWKIIVATPFLGPFWAVAEGAGTEFGDPDIPDSFIDPSAKPHDVTGGPDFGLVLRPAALSFAETSQALTVQDWPTRRFNAPAPDGRLYEFVVNRATQRWWAPRPEPRPRSTDLPNPAGFSGRWGPRVTNDPNSRRAGGKLPDFALLFFEAIAVELNK